MTLWAGSGPEDFSGVGGGTYSNVYRVRQEKLVRTEDCVWSTTEWWGLGQPGEDILCLKRTAATQMPPTAAGPDLPNFKMKPKNWIFAWNLLVFKRCQLVSCFICFLGHLNTGQAKTHLGDLTCEPELKCESSSQGIQGAEYEIMTLERHLWGICPAHTKPPLWEPPPT